MANALSALGIRFGDRVATLAWNGYRHMELYYAVSGSGAVLHTLNPRLHPDQVVWIADHAEDQVLFFDLTFLPLVEAIAPRVKTIKTFVAMTGRDHMPKASKLPAFELDETVTPSPVNPLGVKGVGEAGAIASTAAVANAVIDALSPLGIRHLDMPFTPQKVWRTIQGAQGGQA